MNKCGLLVVLALSTVASENLWHSIDVPSIFEQARRNKGIRNIIRDWKSGKESLPFDLPTLPLKVSPVSFKYDGYTMSTSELVINGLENISLDYLQTSDGTHKITMNTRISIPRVTFQAGWYHLEVKYWIFDIDETGQLSGHIDGLKVNASLTLATRGNSSELRRIRLNFLMDDIKMYPALETTRVQIWNSRSRPIIEEFKDNILEIQREKNNNSFMLNEIKDAINKVLRGQTVEQVIHKIKYYANVDLANLFKMSIFQHANVSE